jgi:Glycosyltransferase family 87
LSLGGSAMFSGSICRLLLVALTVGFFSAFCALASRALCPDFIQFWTAGKILAAGGDPYDVNLQAAIQKDLGWDKQENGLGIYDFLPYYYPPWLAILCTPLVPLGFFAARLVWFALNSILLIASTYLMKDSFPRVARSTVLTIAPFFAMSLFCLQLGQTAILVLFLIAGSWRLLEGGHDRAAGLLLAWTTIKPQLSAVLLLSATLWALRHKRWRVTLGLALTTMVICLASFLVLPNWIERVLNAPRITPMPVEYFPWNGTTWFLLLKGAGVSGWALYAGYGVVAAVALGSIARLALDRGTPLGDLIGFSLLATFLIAPYGRVYDFPVLLVPLLVLLGGRLPEMARALLLVAILVLPYIHWGWLLFLERAQRSPLQNMEITYFWIPALLVLVWLADAAITRRSGRLLSTKADNQPEP